MHTAPGQAASWPAKPLSSRPLAAAAAEAGAPPAADLLASLSEAQRGQVDAFVSFLLQENEKMNLTGAPSAALLPYQPGVEQHTLSDSR